MFPSAVEWEMYGNLQIRGNQYTAADLQILSYHSARTLYKFNEFMQASHCAGGLFINGVVFVIFDMLIQIPFKNVGLLYHESNKK